MTGEIEGLVCIMLPPFEVGVSVEDCKDRLQICKQRGSFTNVLGGHWRGSLRCPLTLTLVHQPLPYMPTSVAQPCGRSQ